MIENREEIFGADGYSRSIRWRLASSFRCHSVALHRSGHHHKYLQARRSLDRRRHNHHQPPGNPGENGVQPRPKRLLVLVGATHQRSLGVPENPGGTSPKPSSLVHQRFADTRRHRIPGGACVQSEKPSDLWVKCARAKDCGIKL